MFVAIVVPLHWLQPGYELANQLISELALGRYGWTMLFAFAGLALAACAVQFAIATYGASPSLRGLLAGAALFFLAAGVFPLGTMSEIHIAAIAIAFVLSVLAMYLYPEKAGRAAPATPRLLSWPLAAGVVAGVALGHSIFPMGIGQRLAAICLLIWLAVLGWRLARQ